jgi:D-alanyl-lipoteichoic acid acyltransferase DltB (MBOAT superfamily)
MIAFFPKVIAGPIVRPSEFVADSRQALRRDAAENFLYGLFFFAAGIIKKVLIADRIALWAAPAFAATRSGASPGLTEAWLGVLAYSLQIYFDFSGYSDMAIGVARLFGYKLPVNFNSPYKAASVVEFWRRWHISLTRFLTEYVYFGLPGHRLGAVRRYMNLFITMVVCGIWHGAGWTFVVWGALHGALLIVNHAWRSWRAQHAPRMPVLRWKAPLLGHSLTLLSVIAGWAVFGSASLGSALRLLGAMAGSGGLQWRLTPGQAEGFLWVAVFGAVACAGPNSQELLGRAGGVLGRLRGRIEQTNAFWYVPGLLTLWLLGMAFMLSHKAVSSPFIYAIF